MDELNGYRLSVAEKKVQKSAKESAEYIIKQLSETEDELENIRIDVENASVCIKVMKRHFQEWLEQKWVAAVDEYNECRYDCELVRL